MSLPIKQIVPATLLLSSLAYFSTTITHMGLPGTRSTIELQIHPGRLMGVKKVSRSGRGYYDFRGIPYAEQPVGQLRFEPPIPAKPWNDTVLDASNYGAFCLQYEFLTGMLQGDEPCLFLNIATPKVVSAEKFKSRGEALFPVFVYFYGGGFMSGFSNVYNPSYFMDENVVFVSVNYRIGLFGFLNTGDDVVRGNMGLKDQTLSLKWIQENIGFFGGDRNRVTLMGQSAGGASSHYHMLSPMSKGLFHRAISQSGLSLSFFALNKTPRTQALRLGSIMNCPTNNTSEMVSCLKALPALELNRANKEYTYTLSNKLGYYAPSVEAVNDANTFLSDTPTNLIRQGKVANIPWIVGSNTNEALIFAILILLNSTATTALNRNWAHYAPIFFDYEDHPNSDNISVAIRERYLGNKNISRETLKETSLMLSDRFFSEPIFDVVRSQAKLSPVYPYYFTYQGEFAFANLLVTMPSFLPRALGLFYSIARRWFAKMFNFHIERIDGCHLDEIPLFFHLSVISNHIIPGSIDYPMSNEVIKVWTNFAYTGKPGKVFDAEWSPVTTSSAGTENVSSDSSESVVKYMKLDTDAAMIPEPFTSSVEFWKRLLSEEQCDNSSLVSHARLENSGKSKIFCSAPCREKPQPPSTFYL